MAEPNIKMTLNVEGIKFDILTTRFHPKDKTPKSYGNGIASMFRPHGDFETGLVKIYKLKDGTYRASTYVDGCFHAQYAKIKFVDDTFDRFLRARDEYRASGKYGLNNRNAIYSKYNLI